MKIHLFIILVAFIVSCNKKDDALPKNKIIEEKQKKTKFIDTISGIYKTEFDSISDCPITLKISRHVGKYYYNLETSKRNLKGKIYFINDRSHLVLEGIPWDEYGNEKDNPKGIPFLIFKDRLKLQNTGNSTNHYKIFGECGSEYIQLMKK